ncbi:MAG: phosphodiesterase YaeI [Chthoniobacterales bacterium]
MNRLFRILADIAIVLGGLVIYARFIEPRWLAIRRIRIPGLPGGERPIRIVHLTDLHASKYVPLSMIAHAVRETVQLKPDLICLTGDYITDYYEDWDAYSQTLRSLAECAPTFAVLGNHDGGPWAHAVGYGYETFDEVSNMLNAAGIRILRNESTRCEIAGRTLHLVGLGDTWSADCIPEQAWENEISSTEAIIVLSHNPDSKITLRPYPWHFMLCGHTHGGQVVFPGKYAPFAEITDRNFARGLCPYAGRLIYINSGVGNLQSWRFSCRPEIAEITL